MSVCRSALSVGSSEHRNPITGTMTMARDAGNYANSSPFIGILFGTYPSSDHEPEAFSIHEPISRNCMGQMLHPIKVALRFLGERRRLLMVVRRTTER
ncbi:MAG: hypothetical protein OSB65_09300 [Roseibacillus sp.]|nr:hypothetical protein [Roseibacillus sp.]|tara:strand:- start:1163 stop:1456 length:294 start_codon:yes stop_codon:yes gene_type:complete